MDASSNRVNATGTDLRKHAVILSGGGAKGAYEIGVMKALFPGYVRSISDGKEIDPVVYTGTSVGAYNAAYLASRPGRDAKTAVAELEDIWRNRIASSYRRPNGVLRFRANPFEGMALDRLLVDPLAPVRNALSDAAFFVKESIERAQGFFASQEKLTRRAVQLVDFSALICTDPLLNLIQDTINLREIRASQDALVVAATNWEEGSVKLFGNLEPKGALAGLCNLDDKTGHLAILASTAIPGVFPPVEINHTKYVDGGLLLNTPLAAALDALRARAPHDDYVLHIIYLDPDLSDVPLGQGTNTLDTVNRLNALAFASQVNRDIKQAKHINQSLELLRSVESRRAEAMPMATGTGEGAPDARRAAAMAGSALDEVQRPFRAFVKDEHRPVTIHRYHPCSMLGGIFGLLAFEADNVGALIEQGFQDAVTHDCDESGCIFPTYSDVTAAARATRKMMVRTGAA